MGSSRDDIDVAALGRAVKLRHRLLIGVAVVVGVGTYIVLSLMTPRFSSEARLLIDSEETVYTRPTVGERGFEPARVDKAIIASQVQVLSSHDLALDVAQKLNLVTNPEFNKALGGGGLKSRILSLVGLGKDPTQEQIQEGVVGEFRQKLAVSAVGTSHVISVKFSSSDPVLAAKVANTLSESYVAWQRDAKLRANKGASEWLSKEIASLRTRVKNAEADAERFRAKSGQQAGRNNVQLNVQQLSELNSQLILAKAQHSEAEARAKFIKGMLDKKQDINAASDVLKSPLVQRLLEQKVTVRRMLSELSATLLPGHPRIRQLNSELSGLRSQIRDEVNKVASGLENEADIAKAREASLNKSLNVLMNRSASASDDTVKLRALQRESKANRDLLESYLARYRDASARQDSSSIPANATIISRAFVSSTPSFPKKGPMTLLFTLASLLLLIAYIVTAELMSGTMKAGGRERSGRGRRQSQSPGMSTAYLSDKLRSDRPRSDKLRSDRPHSDRPRLGMLVKKQALALKDKVEKRVLGEKGKGEDVALVSSSDAPSGLEQDRRQSSAPLGAGFPSSGTEQRLDLPREGLSSIFEDGDGVARHIIDCAGEERGYRVLMTCTDDDLDATAEVVDLVRLISGHGHKVAIVDASEGSRSISGMLRLPRAPGLRELVNGESTFEDVVRRDPESDLHVIPSGNPRREKDGGEEGGEFFGNQGRVFDALDQTYDIVILFAQTSMARSVFQDMDADFDAGVIFSREGEAKLLSQLKQGNFLGFTVTGLEIIYYEQGHGLARTPAALVRERYLNEA